MRMRNQKLPKVFRCALTDSRAFYRRDVSLAGLLYRWGR